MLDSYLRTAVHAFSRPAHRPLVSLDYETFSKADLRKTGHSRYSRDPSTEVLMAAWRWLDDAPDGEVRQWDAISAPEMPAELREIFLDPGVTICAWNAPFEIAMTNNVLGFDVPPSRWIDSMSIANLLALPSRLGKCGAVLGIESGKFGSGSALIQRFCKPRKPTKHKLWTRAGPTTDPDEWEQFLAYNRQDVRAEQEIWLKLRNWLPPDFEFDLWELDQRINDAGLPIDMEHVRAASDIANRYQSISRDDLDRMTGLANANSQSQLLGWLKDHGYPFDDIRKGHVDRWRDHLESEKGTRDLDETEEKLHAVLSLRSESTRTSMKKFDALVNATDDDGHLRHAHQYAGAKRTARWSGRTFQPQNLPRPLKRFEKRIDELLLDVSRDDSDAFIEKHRPYSADALVATIRPSVRAPEGMILCDADLSAIENIVLGWVAEEQKILDVFANDMDPYIDFATDMYRESYDSIRVEVEAGDKTKRTVAKPGVLGCGYRLGPGEEHEDPRTGQMEATGLLGYARSMGIDLSPDMCELSVSTFRSKFSNVTRLWDRLDRAARLIITGKKSRVRVGYLGFDRRGPFMRIRLPSGRYLHYLSPKIEMRMAPWGKMTPQITYMHEQTNQWIRVSTHSGKITENVVQAIARDLLAEGMMRAYRKGIDIRLHVHDQAVSLASKALGEVHLGILVSCLTERPWWTDERLPLKAGGFNSSYFVKD